MMHPIHFGTTSFTGPKASLLHSFEQARDRVKEGWGGGENISITEQGDQVTFTITGDPLMDGIASGTLCRILMQNDVQDVPTFESDVLSTQALEAFLPIVWRPWCSLVDASSAELQM